MVLVDVLNIHRNLKVELALFCVSNSGKLKILKSVILAQRNEQSTNFGILNSLLLNSKRYVICKGLHMVTKMRVFLMALNHHRDKVAKQFIAMNRNT